MILIIINCVGEPHSSDFFDYTYMYVCVCVVILLYTCINTKMTNFFISRELLLKFMGCKFITYM